MKRKIINGIGIGLIAAFIVLLDSVFCAIVFPGKLFIWVAFASWTVFFTAKSKERVKAILGYVIGALCSIAIIYGGNIFFNILHWSINGQSQTSFIATFLIVSLLMICYEFKLLNFTSISSIFIGIWLIFSGLGVGMYPNDVKGSLIIIAIIICYSIIGLIAGALSMKLYKKTENYK